MKKLFGIGVVLMMVLAWSCTMGSIDQPESGWAGTQYPEVQSMMDCKIDQAVNLLEKETTRSNPEAVESRAKMKDFLLQCKGGGLTRAVEEVDQQELIDNFAKENPELDKKMEELAKELEKELDQLPPVTIEVQGYDEAGNPTGEMETISSRNGLLDLGTSAVSVEQFLLWAQSQKSGSRGLGIGPDYGPRNAYTVTADLWPGGKVTYFFDNNELNASQRQIIRDSLQELQESLFDQIVFEEVSYSGGLLFGHNMAVNSTLKIGKKSDSGGQSTVGKTAKNWIDIHPDSINNIYSTIQHEMGHTLGLIHEHQRYDRDSYVNLNWSNIEKDFDDAISRNTNWRRIPFTQSYRFLWYTWTETRTISYTPYDYNSVMHYKFKNLSYYWMTMKSGTTPDNGRIDNRTHYGVRYWNREGRYISVRSWYSPWDIYQVLKLYGKNDVADKVKPIHTPSGKLPYYNGYSRYVSFNWNLY